MRLWATCTVAFLAACSGDEGGDGTDTGAGVTYDVVYDEVLATNCALAGCHPAATNPLDLSDPDASYDALVDVAAAVAGEIYVIPGDAEGSYLYKKIVDAEGITGDPMPPPPASLPSEDVDLIKDWIDAGAPR